MLRHAWIYQLIAFVFLLTSGAAFADDTTAPEPEAEVGAEEEDASGDALDLEMQLLMDSEVVVTATKRVQKIEEAPSIVEVVTAEEIRRHGYRSVGEALRGLPGIAVIDDLVNYNVGMRGLYAGAGSASDTIKVMINGQNTSFRSTAGNSFGPELIPIEAVKRIEIVRGPASALYGANAFLGVVNIITYDGTETPPKTDTAAKPEPGRQGGTVLGTYTQNPNQQNLNGGGSLFAGGVGGPLSYFAAATFYYADRSGLDVPGLKDILQQRLNIERPTVYADAAGYPSPAWDVPSRELLLRHSPSSNDLERVGSAYVNTALALGDAGRLLLDGNFQYFDRFGEFQEYSFLTHANRVAQANGFVRLRAVRDAQDSGLSWNLSLALAAGRPTGDDRVADPKLTNGYVLRKFGYRAVDVVVEAAYAFSKTNIVTLGSDYTNDWEDLFSKEEVVIGTGVTRREGYGDKTFSNLGVYAQWVYQPMPGLNLTAGSRLDHNNVIACDTKQWDCLIGLEDKKLSTEDLKFFLGDVTKMIDLQDRGLLQLSNRIAAVYQLPWAGMYAKAAYGSSFRPPSPFQLYHPGMTQYGSVGAPFLRPQTVDTLELLVGAKPVEDLHAQLDIFYTSLIDYVVSFVHPWGARPDSRNTDVQVVGLEAVVNYIFKDRLSTQLNATWLLDNTWHPKKKWEETDSSYAFSIYNRDLPGALFPTLMIGASASLFVPESNINLSGALQFVGSRNASMVNNQLYAPASLGETYAFDSYLVMDLTVTTVGLKLFSDQETIFSISVRHLPGHYIEPGYGGVDIPGQGPQLLLRLTQQTW